MNIKKFGLSLILVFSIFAACSDSGGIKNDPCAGADAQNNPDCNIAPVCGDDTCAASESYESCPKDCVNTNVNETECGNDVCETGETTSSCPADCKTEQPVCGNGTCDTGETTDNCPADCPNTGSPQPVCGNAICEANEAASNCPEDCSSPSVCGDAKCEQAENYGNCPADCEKPVICGDASCDEGETNETCSTDCPKPPDTFIGSIRLKINDFIAQTKTPSVEKIEREKITLPCLVTPNRWTEIASENNVISKINDLEIFYDKLYVARDDGLFVQDAPINAGDCSPLKKVSNSPTDPITALAATRRNSQNDDYLYVGVSPQNTSNAKVIRLNKDLTWHIDAQKLGELGVNKVSYLAVLGSIPFVANDQVLLKGIYENNKLGWKNFAELQSNQVFISIKSTYSANEEANVISYTPRNLYTLTNFGGFNSLNMANGTFLELSKQLNTNATGSTDIDDVAATDSNGGISINYLFAANNGIYLLDDELKLLENPKASFKKLFVDPVDNLAFALADDSQIYVSKDAGRTWGKIKRSNAPSGINMMYYKDGLLYGATADKVYVTKID